MIIITLMMAVKSKPITFYNQMKVNIAVALVLIRKTQDNPSSRGAIISQLQSNFIKYWSEKRPRDGFENKIFSNLQEKCIRDFIKILPGKNADIKESNVGELVSLVSKCVLEPTAGSSTGAEDWSEVCSGSEAAEQDEKTAVRSCDFLRLVLNLQSLVQSRKPLNFNTSLFNKTFSDCDDSGVDCNRTLSSVTSSILSVPSVKFRLVTQCPDTQATVKVTVEKLLDVVKGWVLNSAEDVVFEWRDSPIDMTISTVRNLLSHDIHTNLVADFVSSVFHHVWQSQQSTQTLRCQIFIISKLLCHIDICTRLVEELIQCVPTWSSAVAKTTSSDSDIEQNIVFVSKGPLVLDLITLVLKKWMKLLKKPNNRHEITGKTTSENIKNLWKAKWQSDKNPRDEGAERSRDYVDTLKYWMMKLLWKTKQNFPLVSPQIYMIVEILDKCKSILTSVSLPSDN